MNGIQDGASAERARSWRLTAVIIAYPLAFVGAALLLKHFKVGIGGAILLVMLAIAGTIVLMRAVDMRMIQLGCASPALRRYNIRMVYGSIAYMVSLFVAVYLYSAKLVTVPLLWGVAMLPAMAILSMVWAMARLLVEEQDEYLRFRLVKQALFACGGLLTIASIWGFLEQFALVPHVPAWAAVPVFALFLGLSQCFRGVRQ